MKGNVYEKSAIVVNVSENVRIARDMVEIEKIATKRTAPETRNAIENGTLKSQRKRRRLLLPKRRRRPQRSPLRKLLPRQRRRRPLLSGKNLVGHARQNL